MSSALWTGSSEKTRSSVQVKKKNWMPDAMSRAAASTCPPSLVRASSSKRSSSTPTAHSSVPAMSTMPASRKTNSPLSDRNGSWRATTYAASSPPSIASPPR